MLQENWSPCHFDICDVNLDHCIKCGLSVTIAISPVPCSLALLYNTVRTDIYETLNCFTLNVSILSMFRYTSAMIWNVFNVYLYVEKLYSLCKIPKYSLVWIHLDNRKLHNVLNVLFVVEDYKKCVPSWTRTPCKCSNCIMGILMREWYVTPWYVA